MKRFRMILLTICLVFFGTVSLSQAQERLPAKSRNSKAIQFGLELRQYKYVEPGYVEHNGMLYGLWGEWLWDNALGGNGRTYGDLIFGSINYDGALCDVSNNCQPYQASTQDVITKVVTRLEYNLNSDFSLAGGVGFRYLYDKGQGIGFYQRTGTWIFLPLGVNFNTALAMGRLNLDAEYDYIIYGSFRSNLSEVSSTFTDLTHSQSGSGLLVSAGWQLEDYSINAFYELWDLNESDTVESNGLFFIEPKNNSQSYGLKLGYRF